MSCQAASCALLNYMRQHIRQVNTTGFPRAHIIQFLSQRHPVSKGEVSTLCEELLANIEEPNGSQRGSGGGSSYLYLVVVVLVVCYLVVLGLLLHRLALRGPEEYGWLLSLVTFDRIPPHVMLLKLLNYAVHPLAQII